MACNITQGRQEVCKESIGGLAGVYFINYTTGSFTKNGSGQVTALPSGSTVYYYELKIPFVASGGMADGRSLVAALALGAEGMNMGTRFIATKEAPVHQNVKDAIVAASELDTRLVMRPLRNTERVLRNDAVDRLLEKEKALGSSIKFDDIIDEVAGVYPKIMLEGTMDAGAWSCGMVAGLIHDIPTVKELIDRIMAEADGLIRQRLARFAVGG